MPTLMTQSTFAKLSTIWGDLAAKSASEGVGPSNIFVPRAGQRLLATSRGIYYIGIATDAGPADGEQTFDDCLDFSEQACLEPRLQHTPFWRFLDRLTREIFGAGYIAAQDAWGWSNLLKIAGSYGEPHTWPAWLVDEQRAACAAALREELGNLNESLIVIVSDKEYGILYEITGDKDWNKDVRPSRTYWRHDPRTGNTYVHCYHPKYMALKGLFEPAVNDVVRLARETLPQFI
jgi:hypothetical protein